MQRLHHVLCVNPVFQWRSGVNLLCSERHFPVIHSLSDGHGQRLITVEELSEEFSDVLSTLFIIGAPLIILVCHNLCVNQGMLS